MANNIGPDPTKKNLTLSWKSWFAQEYQPETLPDYPIGTTSRIELYQDEGGDIITTLNATLSDDRTLLQFLVPPASLDAVPDGAIYHMYQGVPMGEQTVEFLRYYGVIQRKEGANGALSS